MRIQIFYLMRIRIRLSLYPDADPDPSSELKAQTLEKVLKWAHNPYILAYHLQIEADPDPGPDPAYHFDVDPD
jgi:hypothetical protein